MPVNTCALQGEVYEISEYNAENRRGHSQINLKLRVLMPRPAKPLYFYIQFFEDLADEVALGIGDYRPLRKPDEIIVKGWLNSFRAHGKLARHFITIRVTEFVRIEAAKDPGFSKLESAVTAGED